MRPRILLTGGNGQIGWELRRTLGALGDIVVTDSRTLDLTNADALRIAVRANAPAIIVNAAAYTAVDRAENEPERARAVNAVAPGVLAEEAARTGALLVHYSTDYVFDGSGDLPWREDDAAGPLNVYGASKLEGEQAVAASGCAHFVFRTSWVYGLRGGNFLLTMRRLLRERPELKIVADQVGAPTWCRDVAEATAQVLARVVPPADGAGRHAPWGVYHMTNGGETSWYGFTEAIRAFDDFGGADPAHLLPISSGEYPTPARRPLNSRLDNGKLQRTFGVQLRDWREALRLCLDTI